MENGTSEKVVTLTLNIKGAVASWLSGGGKEEI